MKSEFPHPVGMWLRETIFPTVCHFCRRRCYPAETLFENVCRQCLVKLPFRYGNERLAALRVDSKLPAAICAFHYKGLVQQALLRLKFGDSPEISTAFAAFLTDALLRQGKSGVEWSAVLAVPLHAERERERGYNQAGLIAQGIARRLLLPDWSFCLGRNRSTSRQSELKTMSERLRNVENAFYICQPEPIRGRHLLLIDDILSTGATMQAARTVLLAEGAASVTLAAAAS